MQTVDEKPETIHLYVVREEEPKPSVFPIVLSALSLVVLLVFCVVAPYQQPVTRAVIRVPAVLLPLRTFTEQVAVIPTGIRTYPATIAHGVLTITNGSVIAQTLPAGFKFLTNRGIQIVTDSTVFVPSGDATGYGYAAVSVHALLSGSQGNTPALGINQVIGSSVYVRNLQPFTGGRDAYSVKYITSNDRTLALSNIRNILSSKITGLHYPCKENISGNSNIQAVWVCQFVTYKIPSFMSVSSIRILGKNLLIAVAFTPRQVRVGLK